jgi:hypothetical protein
MTAGTTRGSAGEPAGDPIAVASWPQRPASKSASWSILPLAASWLTTMPVEQL